MPTRKKGEKKSKFISRYMGDSKAMKDFPNQKQRLAVAYSEAEKVVALAGIFKGGGGSGQFPNPKNLGTGTTSFGGYEVKFKEGQHHVMVCDNSISQHPTYGDAVKQIKQNIIHDRKAQAALAKQKAADEADDGSFNWMNPNNPEAQDVSKRPFVGKREPPFSNGMIKIFGLTGLRV